MSSLEHTNLIEIIDYEVTEKGRKLIEWAELE